MIFNKAEGYIIINSLLYRDNNEELLLVLLLVVPKIGNFSFICKFQ